MRRKATSGKYPSTGGIPRIGLGIARRDIESAKFMLKKDPYWSYCIAYNAILQSLRAFMFLNGYRPSSDSHHAAVIRFAAVFFDGELVRKVDRMRRRSSTSTYDQSGTISQRDAEAAVSTAEEVLKLVEGRTTAP